MAEDVLDCVMFGPHSKATRAGLALLEDFHVFAN